VKLHGNARLTPFQRALMCRRVRKEHWTVARAAEAAGCSTRTCHRWLARFDRGEAMTDRSSAPASVPTRTPRRVEREIERLRRLRFTSTRIAATLEMPVSTVCAVLGRLGLNRLWKLGPPEPANRYCRRHAGELVHVDVKKLGRIERGAGWRVRGGPQHYNRTFTDRNGLRRRTVGWEYVHIAVDDYSRLAYAEVLADERAATAAGFLRRAVAFYRRHGIRVERVITDNGAAYTAHAHALACRQLALTHLRTRPYRPQTNEKAERFIRTLLAGWAYGAIYRSSSERTTALDGWLWHYNHRRKHSALGHQPPISRTNLLGSYS
jgi:transposase InsO family protein